MTAAFLRLLLLLAALVLGAVVCLIGFDAIHADDVKLFGYCGLGLIALALAGLIRE